MTKKLDNPINSQVENLRQEFIQHEMKDEYDKAKEVLLEAWNLLPEPKLEYDESFHISSYLIDTYINLNDFKEAKKWVKLNSKSNLDRHDAGEREYLAGKVEYELGNHEKAKEYFKVVDEKSKGRIFQQGDVKYYKFYKKK